MEYTIHFDFDRDGTFSHELTDRIVGLTFQAGFQDERSVMAPLGLTSAVITLWNHDGAFSQDNAAAAYYGMLKPNTLVRISADGVPLWIGKFASVRMKKAWNPSWGRVDYTLEIVCDDPLYRLTQETYVPRLLTGVRLDELIQQVFDDAVLPYPYDGQYWIVGASRVGVDTRLFDELATALDTSPTVLEWAGDDTGETSAYNYLYSALANEPGARFYWDARAGKFRYTNRRADVVNRAVDTALTSDVLTSMTWQHGANLYNHATVAYTLRTTGTPGTTLYKYAGTFRLDPYGTRTVRGGYAVEEEPVAGYEVTAVKGVDIVASWDAGGANDATGSMVVSVDARARDVEYTLENPSPQTMYIQKLEAQGTPLYLEQATVEESDPASVKAYNRSPLRVSLTTSAIEHAEAYARTIVSQYATPRSRLSEVEFVVATQTMSAALAAGYGYENKTGEYELTGNPGGNDYIRQKFTVSETTTAGAVEFWWQTLGIGSVWTGGVKIYSDDAGALGDLLVSDTWSVDPRGETYGHRVLHMFDTKVPLAVGSYWLVLSQPTGTIVRAYLTTGPINADGEAKTRTGAGIGASVIYNVYADNATQAHAMAALGTGSLVNITDATTGHDNDYVIIGEQHEVGTFETGMHRVRWYLKDIDRSAYWILGNPVYSRLGRTTVPAW
jgi:hypothetical protein